MPLTKVKLRLRILVVQEDKGGDESIDSVLRDVDVDCVPVADGEQAGRLLRKEKFDAVFLDGQMPAPGGMHLARLIRSGGLNSRTPIIFVSGEATPEVMTHAFDSGANLFLFKPFDRSRLLQVMRAARGPIEQERRRFLRVSVRRHVVLLKGEEREEGHTVDLSLEGMLVETAAGWATRTRIQIKLEIVPGEEPVLAAGKITRLAGPNKMGIQFERLSDNQNARLQNFLLPLILESLGE